MGLYELSIEPSKVEEAEALVSMEALAQREFPTLVARWDSSIFGQAWETTIVLDYVIALPPLEPPATFIPVRIAAQVGNVPTKYLYFGTEMSSTVPRLAPQMENLAAPQSGYQEFLIDERTSPVPYLKLIQATPRIYGNGAQDYYAPPIKIERYDGVVSPEHLADLFPTQVANLPSVEGSLLTDPSQGFWTGSRYAGIRSIAIIRQGKVVGMHRKQGRSDKEFAPPVVHQRDPKQDIRPEWVVIDVGAKSFTVASCSERGSPELFRIGTTEPVTRPSDYENPSEIAMLHLKNALRSWRERVILPHTLFEDVRVGFGVESLPADLDPIKRAAAMITELPLIREVTENKRNYKLRGYRDPETAEMLKKPAPPVIDEEGIGAHDPFDPLELYAYQIGLTVNQRSRGLHTKYLVSMPTGWPAERRRSVLIAMRRGLFRSLPVGMLQYHELDKLIVADAGPSAICFLAHAHRAFSAIPKDGPIMFAVFEAGASETGMVFGNLREPSHDEKKEGFSLIIEHLDAESIPWFGAERLLSSLAYRVYAEHAADVIEQEIPFEAPEGEQPLPGGEALLVASPEARANARLFKQALRPVFEGDPTYRLPTSLKLASMGGGVKELKLTLNRQTLRQQIDAWFGHAVAHFHERLKPALQRLARESDPYEGLRVFMGGRLSMHSGLQDTMQKALPSNVRVHKYREPDRTNLLAATVKTATALGALALRLERIGVAKRAEERDAFRYRVGRGRHGQLVDVVDPSTDYDVWCDMAPCLKPTFELLYMQADYDGEVAADDPRVMKVECELGDDAVGKRIFIRSVAAHRVELGLGEPGEDPNELGSGGRLAVDLSTAMTFPL